MAAAPLPPVGIRRLATMFNNPEYERLVRYAKKKGLSIYALVKKAVREYLEKHP